MRCQVEKNKEILCDEIEKLSSQKMNESNAAKLSMYRGAYKALCMAEGEPEDMAGQRPERPEPTPELDGDTEFERVIMSIPADKAHMVKITRIFDKYMRGLQAVNARAYNSVMEQLRELVDA